MRVSNSTLVIVVDALDECDKETDVRTILELWSQLSQVSAFTIRLFLTSRPDLPIRLSFRRMSVNLFQNVDLVDAIPSEVIEHDLAVYFSARYAPSERITMTASKTRRQSARSGPAPKR